MKVVEKLNWPVQVGNWTTNRRFTDQVFQNWGLILKPSCQQQHQIDDNNCIPLALMCLTDTTLIQSTQFCQDHLNRQHQKGVMGSQLIKQLPRLQLGGYSFKIQGVNPILNWHNIEKQTGPLQRYTQPNGKSWTLQRFVEQHPNGRYLIIVKDHALALINGKLMGHAGDQYLKPSQRVYITFKAFH